MRASLAVIEEVARWVGPLFGTFGYAIVPLAVVLETSAFVGLIVPGDVVLALGGVYASRGELALGWVVALGLVASVAGQSAGYWLGRRYGKGLARRLPLPGSAEERIDRAKGLFDRHGGKAVFIGRFAAGIATLTPFVAGASDMRFVRFLAFAVPAVVIWGTAVTLLGFFLGENLALIDRLISRFGWIVAGLVVAGLGIAWFVRRRRD